MKAPQCVEPFQGWLERQIIAARRQFDTATSLKVRRRSWDAVLILQGVQQEYTRRTNAVRPATLATGED
jgi:hypothetical protein